MLAEIPELVIRVILSFLGVVVVAAVYWAWGRGREKTMDTLYSACMFGDLESAREILSQHRDIDLNSEDDNMNTHSMLSAAVYGGNPEIVALLVSRGADVNREFDCLELPLQAAISSDSPLMVELLLKLGADPDKEDLLHCPPLYEASWKGNADIVRLLVKYGATLDAVDEDGDTAMHMAASEGHEDIMRLLSDLGARNDLRNNEGKTPQDELEAYLADADGGREHEWESTVAIEENSK